MKRLNVWFRRKFNATKDEHCGGNQVKKDFKPSKKQMSRCQSTNRSVYFGRGVLGGRERVSIKLIPSNLDGVSSVEEKRYVPR